ncbi:MAG: quinolinate synthase, partial [Candidatus Helarchaeota archaeon]
LSRIAQKETKSDIIIFAGVDFMAETACILNPEKTVYIPDVKATCPMANMCPAETIIAMKKKYNLPVVLYVNTKAEAKAHAEIMCTSANAVKICKSLNSNSVIFGPDRNLGWYVHWKTDLEIVPVPEDGYCYVHRKFEIEDFERLKEKYPDAKITVHPECNPEVQQIADHVGSTAAIKRYILNTYASDFIIGTEVGLKFAIQKELKEKKGLHFAREDAVCRGMKLITLKKIRQILLEYPKENIVSVPEPIAKAARKGIERMLELS